MKTKNYQIAIIFLIETLSKKVYNPLSMKTFLKLAIFLVPLVIFGQQSILTPENEAYLNMLPPDARTQLLSKIGGPMMQNDQLPPVSSSLFDRQSSTTFNPLLGSKKKFGYDFFKKTPSSFAPLNDLPIPNTYIINTGDLVELVVLGNEQMQMGQTIRVNLDGTIQIPKIGNVQVSGLNIQEANDKVNSVYSEVSIGTKVILSMKELQPFQIFILGASNNPGAYTVNPLTTISNALILSGGVDDYGSLRNIELKRGQENYKFDLYKQLIYGDRSEDRTLRAGDTIFIPPAINFVEVSGKVNRPLTYEVTKNDKLSDVIKYAQEIKFDGDETRLIVRYLEENNISNAQMTVDDNLSDSRQILSIDVRSKSLESNLAPTLYGPIKKNNFISTEETDLGSLIEKLEFTEDLYPFFGAVVNRVGRFKIETFSLADKKTYQDILLPQNSNIYFFTNKDIDLFNEFLIETTESVGDLENELLNEYIRITNNFRAEEEVVEVPQEDSTTLALRREIEAKFNDSFVESSVQSKFDPDVVDLDAFEKYQIARVLEQQEILDASEKLLKYEFYLENPEVFKVMKSNSISLQGEFTKEGLYPVNGDINLRNLIEYIGGFTPLAETEMLEYIDLSNNVSVLSPDDSYVISNPINATLSVPSSSSKYVKVKIIGEVQNPGDYTLLPGTTLDELYERAGGLKENASSKSIVLSRRSVKQAERAALETSKKKILDGIFYGLTNSTASESTGNVGDLVAIFNLADQAEPIGRVVGDLSPGGNTSRELMLENNDEIYVFNRSQTISVIGEVNSSSTIFYNSRSSLKDYIEATGGFTDYADKGEVYIISSDGTARLVNNRYFNSFDSLQAGDTIVVPKKLLGISGLPLVQIITRSVSDIAFAAASLNAIRN